MPAIDPPNGPPFALKGRVVTMDASSSVIERGVVYVDRSRIAAVRAEGAAPPPGFDDVDPLPVRGTIYPGLIELHNHLSYDVLPLWPVDRRYDHRGQWPNHPAYRRLISGPMQVLGKTPGMPEAIVRFVECKCLLGGVTTSQGIRLFSNSGIQSFYRGLVRNVEDTDEADLPEARGRIPDVAARDAAKFLAQLEKPQKLLLHLSEGAGSAARSHFLALRMVDRWALNDRLVGIHCNGLESADFDVLAAHGVAMVWSPLSNLLLYGRTADVRAARAAGVPIGLGSDWSPSGSRSLLGELKVARAYGRYDGGAFSAREIVAMATRDAAAILGWQEALGSIEAGKRADLVVVEGVKGDPYEKLLDADEKRLSLVVVNGWPRVGRRSLMAALGCVGEELRIGGAVRLLHLEHPSAHPAVAALTLRAAVDRLREGLHNLVGLAARLEGPAPAVIAPLAFRLDLDHDESHGDALRHHLPYGAEPTGADRPALAEVLAAAPLSQILGSMSPDRLTFGDDDRYWSDLASNPNLPAWFAAEFA
ncbi:MAG: amidohydrolase family protein [Planctomycetes bacterium]|nr:amidohydrolase family protein [Planctomycetota bacterium]